MKITRDSADPSTNFDRDSNLISIITLLFP